VFVCRSLTTGAALVHTIHVTHVSLCSNLLEQGFKRGPNTIIPVWSLLQPLKTRQVAGLLPPDIPCR